MSNAFMEWETTKGIIAIDHPTLLGIIGMNRIVLDEAAKSETNPAIKHSGEDHLDGREWLLRTFLRGLGNPVDLSESVDSVDSVHSLLTTLQALGLVGYSDESKSLVINPGNQDARDAFPIT